MIDLAVINRITGGKLGTFDAACPMCSLTRKPANRRKRVLRIWRTDPGFASYCCAHCAERGFVRDDSTTRRIDPAQIERAKAEAEKRDRETAEDRQRTARRLWAQSKPIAGTIAEKYLATRGITCSLPSTLCYLPARGIHPDAMIAAFGLAHESDEPGVISIDDDAIVGVHLTRLSPDGTGKAGTECDKTMIGKSLGFPIVLAPPNDLVGLTICEGIEDAASVFQSTGLGAWAAGSASRMLALADVVPDYIECVTVFAHNDDAGQRGARDLANALSHRGIEVLVEGLHHG